MSERLVVFGPSPDSLINRIVNIHVESDKAFGPLALPGHCLPRSSFCGLCGYRCLFPSLFPVSVLDQAVKIDDHAREKQNNGKTPEYP